MVDGMICHDAGCHSAHEDSMIDYHVSELCPRVDEAIENRLTRKFRRTGKLPVGKS
jgi:hypothetical protein